MATRLAIAEVTRQSWATTRQFLYFNALATDQDGLPIVAWVDASIEPGAFWVYFPVVEKDYFLIVFVRPEKSGRLAVSGTHWEAHTRAKLLLSSETLLPDEITRVVGLTPTSGRARDPDYKFHHLRALSQWSFEARVGIPGPVESKLTALLEAVAPRAKAIASLGSSCRIVVSLLYRSWLGNGSIGGLSVGPEELAIVSSLGADLDFDVYVSGPWLTDDDDQDQEAKV